MPNVKLTEIPIELQSHILNKLFTQPLVCSKAPLEYTVEAVTWFLETFPDDLLHAAQASNTLRNAVICTLGSHAKFLSFGRSLRLSEWIAVLARHVKAVSLTGIDVLGHYEQVCEEVNCQCYLFHETLLDALKALQANDVALVALNLEEIANPNSERIEEIAEHMVKALRRSRSSLREIAVNVNRATALAMPRVTLPNLEVAQISSEDYEGNDHAVLSDVPRPAKLFSDILQGINGSVRKLRELRLYNMHESPILDRESWPTLFLGVEKLIMMCGKTSKHREIAIFISNFRNVRSICWFTGLICPEDMSTILAGCPDLKALDLSTSDRHILPGEVNLGQNSNKLKDLFISFQGKLSNLDVSTYLSCAQIKYLGENCQNLLTLEMEIDAENVGTLSLLLGTHCRMLRALRLHYFKSANGCLGRNGWHAYTKGICSASDELRGISLIGDAKGAMLESATDEMVVAINDVLEFLGDRAASVVFRVPINTHNPFIVLEVLSCTLKVAKTHCRSMRTLCLDFIKDHSLGGYQVENAQENDLLDTFFSVCRLQREFALCEEENGVDIGDIDALWEEQWEEEEEEGADQDMGNIPAELADVFNGEL